MADKYAQTLEAMEEVADSLRHARLVLGEAEERTREALRAGDQGVPSAAVLRANPVAEGRPPVDEALTRLERARHAVLLEVFELAIEDGMTIGELGRNYGFSRQRAARYAKDARERHAP